MAKKPDRGIGWCAPRLPSRRSAAVGSRVSTCSSVTAICVLVIADRRRLFGRARCADRASAAARRRRRTARSRASPARPPGAETMRGDWQLDAGRRRTRSGRRPPRGRRAGRRAGRRGQRRTGSRPLMASEKKRAARVAAEAAIHDMTCGDDEGQIPLPQAGPPRPGRPARSTSRQRRSAIVKRLRAPAAAQAPDAAEGRCPSAPGSPSVQADRAGDQWTGRSCSARPGPFGVFFALAVLLDHRSSWASRLSSSPYGDEAIAGRRASAAAFGGIEGRPGQRGRAHVHARALAVTPVISMTRSQDCVHRRRAGHAG